ncbi:MAG: hypothetical protein NZ699_16845 [Roseiflexus sp.]|nr:hypothetical protein [Roseiflexus sp.]MCS7290791.1 hypothetical protein [Roseiflexus sp.]MDW8144816.1 hypothetical protein [Roseiflexaceae bacterium]MDW8232275.1 hypothetical protein [Roseiflexaceae bacterium]
MRCCALHGRVGLFGELPPTEIDGARSNYGKIEITHVALHVTVVIPITSAHNAYADRIHSPHCNQRRDPLLEGAGFLSYNPVGERARHS